MAKFGVGQPVRRVEDQRFLTGQGRYVDDIVLPGMLHACNVLSPHAHAKIKKVDVSKAKAAPGVLLVLTGADIVAEKIGALTSAFIDPGTPVVIPKLTYGLYAQVSAAGGAVVTRVEPAGLGIDLEAVAHAVRSTHARLAWLCDPNNPTGTLMDAGEWRAFLDRLPGDCVVVADEAYMDFADPSLRAPRLEDVVDGRPVVVVRSFSKIFGLAGLRLGYAVADPQVARLMHIVQEPFNVNRVALAAGRAAVAATGFVEARRAEVAEARDVLTAELTASGFRCHPSQANFVLVELGTDDQPVCDRLASRGMLIRGGTEFGLPGFARITVAPPPVMRQAAAAVTEAVHAVT